MKLYNILKVTAVVDLMTFTAECACIYWFVNDFN